MPALRFLMEMRCLVLLVVFVISTLTLLNVFRTHRQLSCIIRSWLGLGEQEHMPLKKHKTVETRI